MLLSVQYDELIGKNLNLICVTVPYIPEIEGGLVVDRAIRLANALATITDVRGQI